MTVLHPASEIGLATGWSYSGGAGNYTVLGDSNDASYLLGDGTGAHGSSYGFGGYVLPAGGVIRSIQLSIRIASNNIAPPGNAAECDALLYTSGAQFAVPIMVRFVNDHTPVTLYSNIATVNPYTGLAWTQNDINSLLLLLYNDYSNSGPGVVGRFVEVSLIVDDNQRPTVTMPATTLIGSLPTVDFTYTDPEGDAIERIRLKVFDAGFVGNPEDTNVGPLVYDSGEIFTSATAHTLDPTKFHGGRPKALFSLNYVFAVKAADAGSNGQFGSWSTATRLVTAGSPALPVLESLTDDDPNGRVALQLQGRDNILVNNAATMTTDATAWVALLNCAIAYDVTNGPGQQGTGSLKMTSSAGGDMKARTVHNVQHAVSQGQIYTILGSARPGSTTRTVRFDVEWYDNGNVLISTSAGPTVAEGAAAWAQALGTVVSPANATYARVVAVVLATGGAAEVHYIDDVLLSPDGTNTTWTIGGLFLGAVQRYFVVQKSEDGGTTWADITGSPFFIGDPVNGSSWYQQLTVYDYTATPGTPTLYRAAVVTSQGAQSAWTANAGPVTFTISGTGWWLKDPLDQTGTYQVQPDVMGNSFDQSAEAEFAVYNPLGRENSIVVRDVFRGETMSLKLEFLSKANYNKFEVLRKSGKTLLLQSGWLSEQWYIQIVSARKLTRENTNPPLFDVEVDVVEQDVPTVS